MHRQSCGRSTPGREGQREQTAPMFWTLARSQVAAVVGVGPGLGLEISRRFAREGYAVAILARDYENLTKYAEQLAEEAPAQVAAIRIDCSDAKSLNEAFEAVNSLGAVEVLVYNTSGPYTWPPLKFIDISADSFERSLNIRFVGAVHCVQQVLQGMIERKRGTILLTGATGSIRGSAGFSKFAVGKFDSRALGNHWHVNYILREYMWLISSSMG